MIHLRNADDEECFLTAKGINSLYDAALKYYCDFVDLKDEYTLDCLVERFDSYDYLDEPVFNVLSDAQKRVMFNEEIETYLQEINGEGQGEDSTMHL